MCSNKKEAKNEEYLYYKDEKVFVKPFIFADITPHEITVAKLAVCELLMDLYGEKIDINELIKDK
jgi:hypothetical protein